MSDEHESGIQPCPAACGTPVLWVLDNRGHSIPVDAEPTPDGTLSLSHTWDGKVRAVKPSPRLAFGRTNLHKPHTATCGRLAILKTLV